MQSFVKIKLSQNGKITLFFIDKVNLALVENFHITNMSFNVTRENKILAKISESTVQVDYISASYFCSRNESDPNIAHLTISFMWYKYPWVQAMKTATYMGSGPTPDGIQVFVQGDPVGSCSGMLSNPNSPGNNDSVVLTLSMNPADSEAKRCGFNVVSKLIHY